MATINSANFGTGTSGQVLTSNGAGVAPTFQAGGGTGVGRLLSFQILTSGTAATYTKNVSATNILVECVGGGGGGGTASTSGISASGGGGSGGYCRKWITSAASTYTYTIGAGGASASNGSATTFSGSSLSAGGGSAGSNSAGVTTVNSIIIGGAGGTSSGGDVNEPGDPGGWGQVQITYGGLGGNGGSSFLGGGALAGPVTTGATLNAPGVAAGANSGGGGSGCSQNSGSNQNGGAGGSGLIIVWEYS